MNYCFSVADQVPGILGRLEALTVSDPDDATSGTPSSSMEGPIADLNVDTWGHPSDEMVSDSDSDYNIATSP